MRMDGRLLKQNIMFNNYNAQEVHDHPHGRWQHRKVGTMVWIDAKRGVRPPPYARLVQKKGHRYIHRWVDMEWRWMW